MEGPTALILDGEQRSALAAARSLGSRGVRVFVGAERKRSLAAASRYCSGSFSYASPRLDPEGFLRDLKRRAEEHSGAVLFPMTDITVATVLAAHDELGCHVRLPFPAFDRYRALSDKRNLVRVATGLGVPLPRTVLPLETGGREGLLEQVRALGYPVVVKPASSRFRTDRGWVEASVRYARGEPELARLLDEEPFRSFPFLVQERIEGPGIGVFLLLWDGEVRARFAHRRIREKPPSGGVSVLSESVEPHPVALKSAEQLLKTAGWQGVAMVEFKLDRRDGEPKLIEVNARFWGSLQLAISAGVDFPHLLFRLAMGESIPEAGAYRVGLRSQWELGELDHLLLRLRKGSGQLHLPPDAPSRLAAVAGVLGDYVSPKVRSEVFRWGDPGPFLIEMQDYLTDLLGTAARP